MAEKFDPYRTWLGIPPEEQPPNHYRLLGVGLFESLPDVIANAADRQMVHVRTFQSGKHSKVSQQILNELSAARVSLLDPEKKALYDEQLRQKLADSAAGSEADVNYAGPDLMGRATTSRRRTTGRGARKKKSAAGLIVVLVVVGVLVAAAFVFLLSNGGTIDALRNAGSDDAARHGAPATTSKRTEDGKKQAAADKAAKPAPAETSKAPAEASRPSASGGPSMAFNNLPAQDNASGPVGFQPAQARPMHKSGPKIEPGKIGELGQLEGHTAAVTGVAIDKFGSRIVSGSLDGTVRQWDFDERREVWTFEGGGQPVLKAALSTQPPTVLVACGTLGNTTKSTIRSWSIHKRPLEATLDLPSLIRDLAVSDDTVRVVLAGQDGTIRSSRWKWGNREKFTELPGHQGPVRAVAITGDHTWVLSGGEDRTVRWWNVEEKREVHKFPGHEGPVTCVAIASDGHYGASGSADGSVRIWDLTNLSQRRVLAGPSSPLTAVLFLPDGKRLLSAAEDGIIRLWKLSSAREVYRFKGHRGAVRSLALDAQGTLAISGGDDNLIRLWALPASDAKLPPLTPDASAVLAAPSGKRPAIPAADAQVAVEATVKNERFKGEFSVVELPKKAALAKKLLAEAQRTDAEPVTQFVLLRLAKDMAAASGDVEVLFAVIDRLVQRFEMDLLAARVSALEEAGGAALPQAVRRVVVEKALATLPELAAADRFDLAQRLAAMLRSNLAKVRDPVLTKQFQSVWADMDRALADGKALTPLREKLRAQPDDPQANEALGRNLCFTKGRWDEGLSNLARGSAAELRKLAQTDLDGPDEPDAQVALADGWWALGEKESGIAQQGLRKRACWWYAMAEPEVTGDVRGRVKKRLAEAAGQPEPQSAFDIKPAPGVAPLPGATK